MKIEPLALADVDFKALLKGTDYATDASKIKETILRKAKTWQDIQNLPSLFGLRVCTHPVHVLLTVLNERLDQHVAAASTEPVVEAAEAVEATPEATSTKRKK